MDLNELSSLLGYSQPPPTAESAFGIIPDVVPPAQPVEPAPLPIPAEPPSSILPGASPAPQVSPGQSRGTSSSSGERGFSEQKYKQVSKATSGLQGRIDADVAKVEGRFADNKADATAAAGAETESNLAYQDAEVEQIEFQARAASARDALLRRQAEEDAAAVADARAAAATAKADYRARLESIPSVNPDALYDNAGNVGKFGMMAAAFMHDFLGAKGIKTSAMDIMNGAIQRNIDAQIQNINSKKQVAEGFKQLWDMERADSASETEARLRMQAHSLKALDAKIASIAGGYDSKLAAAKQQAARAQIQKDLAKTQMEIDKAIELAADQAADRQITLNGQMVQASIASQNRASAERIAAAELAAKGKEAAPSTFIFDPERGKGVLKFRPGTSKERINEVQKKAADFFSADKGMRELRDLARKIGSAPDGMPARLLDEDKRLYKAKSMQIARQMLASVNERATDKDIDQTLMSMPTDTWLTNGGISTILADTHKTMHDKFKGEVYQVAEDVPEDLQPSSAKGGILQASGAEAAAVASGAEKLEPTAVDAIEKKVVGPTGLRADTKTPREDQMAYQSWAEFGKVKGTQSPEVETKELLNGNAEYAMEAKRGEVPTNAFVGMYELANLAMNGSPEAEAKLEKYAKGGTEVNLKDTSGKSMTRSGTIKDYAQFFLDKVEASKNAR